MWKGILLGAAMVAASGAAKADTANLALSGFSKIKVSAGVTTQIVAGAPYAVRAEGGAEALARLDARVDGDTLVLGRKHRDGWSWKRRDDRVVVYVSTPKLDSLDASSGASATATGVESTGFAAQASSGAAVTIAGSCGAFSADASSGASLSARAFKCKTLNADASSGASITAFASESVAADASSGGSISVSGGPKSVTQESSSGGSVSVGQ